MRKPPLQPHLVWHCYLLAAICGLLASVWLWQAGLAFCLLIFFDRRLWTWQRLPCLVLAFAGALFYGQQQLARGYAVIKAPPDWINKSVPICGDVQSSQGLVNNRLRLLLANVRSPSGETLPGYCQWTWENPQFRPLPGQAICLTRPLRPVSGFGNQTGDAWLAWLLGQKIYWRIWSEKSGGDPVATGEGSLFARTRADLQRRFAELLEPAQSGRLAQSRAILIALLFGDRSYLSQKTADLFASATLAHSLALSGQHLAIAGLLGALLVICAARCSPDIYLARPRRQLVLFLAIPFALLYLWLGNGPASLLRAFGMLAFAAIWLSLGRSFTGLDLLCAALLIILISNPLAIFDTGLEMSALCVAVIVLSAPGIRRIMPERNASPLAQHGSRLLLIVVISLLIQIALLPVSLEKFQLAGFWFPLNLLWLPLLGLVVLPFAAFALLLNLIPLELCHFAATWCIALAAAPCELVLHLLGWLANPGLLTEPVLLKPHLTAILAFALLAVSLAWLAANRQRTARIRLMLFCALLLMTAGPCLRLGRIFTNDITIEAIDVGQGQAILINLPANMRILVDGGGSYRDRFDPGKQITGPLLSANRAPALTAVINTHPDLDHLGGLFYILDKFQVERAFDNGRPAPGGKGELWAELRKQHNVTQLTAGDRIAIGDPGRDIALEVLYPPRERKELGGNAASLILRLTRNGKGLALVTGDSEKAGLAWMLANCGNATADLVFAPHHGSDKNLLPDFYEKTRPALVIASCGFMNRWRYPGRKLSAWLKSRKIRLLDTGTNGRIAVTFRPREQPQARTWLER